MHVIYAEDNKAAIAKIVLISRKNMEIKRYIEKNL